MLGEESSGVERKLEGAGAQTNSVDKRTATKQGSSNDPSLAYPLSDLHTYILQRTYACS